MQEQYWSYMVQTKFSVYYLDNYAENIYKKERNINVFCAIASSASIAAWAVWTEWAYVWGFIIAISQVLTSVKEYFPYARQLKMLKHFVEEMKMIYINIEQEWFRVAEGNLTENEINKLLFMYKKKVTELESKYLSENILVENLEYAKKADKQCTEYFERNFK